MILFCPPAVFRRSIAAAATEILCLSPGQNDPETGCSEKPTLEPGHFSEIHCFCRR